MENLSKSFSEAVIGAGEKRKSNSPLASKAKEPMLEDDIPDSEREEISIQLEQISSLNNKTYIPNNPRPSSKTTFKAASEASFGNHWERGLTDLVQMEFLTYNGQPFNISIARPEILYVWTDIMGVDPSLVFGISTKKPMNRGLMASVKLKKQVQIDDIFSKPDFSYNRGQAKSDGSFDIVTGRILGLRAPPPPRNENEEQQRPGFTRVNVYGLAFDIDKDKVENWLCHFGDVLEFDDIMDRDLPDLATGDVSVKMKLRKNIPCYLPMYGKKIRIAYRGMPTICSNCFEVGHIRINCHGQRVAWLDYVKNIHSTGRFDDDLFGKWNGILKAKQNYSRPSQPLRQRLEDIPETNTIEPDEEEAPELGNGDGGDDQSPSVSNSNSNAGQGNDEGHSQTSEPRSIIGTIADYLLNK